MDITTNNIIKANIYDENTALSDAEDREVFSVILRLEDFEEGFLDDVVKGTNTITIKSRKPVIVGSNNLVLLGELLNLQAIKNQPKDSVFLGRECVVYFKKHEMKNPIGELTHVLILERVHVEVGHG